MSSRAAVPSRSDTQSISSRSDRASERGTDRRAERPAVESAVTRLLVSTKSLLEALSLWSRLTVDEQHISDLYVRFGNDFNLAVHAFAAYNIDMSELLDVPNELRGVLEQCLAEDASQESLDVYLPTVRDIITRLLQGLRGKQSAYRRIVQDYRHRSNHDRTDSRSSSSRRDHPGATTTHRSQLSRSTVDGSTAITATTQRVRESSTSRRGTPPPPPPVSSADEPPAEKPAAGAQTPAAPTPSQEDPSPVPIPQPNGVRTSQQQQQQHRRQRSHTNVGATPPRLSQQVLEQELPPRPDPPTGPLPQVPPSVKRYSLVDKPMQTTTTPTTAMQQPPPPVVVVVDDVQSPTAPETPQDQQVPAIADSLAALKTLERRASKRFSTYNISKMTGASLRDRLGRSGSHRRSLAAGSAPTPGELAVLTEVEEVTSPPEEMDLAQRAVLLNSTLSKSSPPPSRVSTPPPLPPKNAKTTTTEEYATPTTKRTMTTPNAVVVVDRSSDTTVVASESPVPPSANSITVFLQVGREVKKVTIEPGLSFSSLRMLFVDKFSYNPGMENFPAIYIRDPSSGVQYELEDVEEVKEKCLLSLNIEPLDQIKQHIDTQISMLSQDLKELRTAVSQTTRGPTIIGQPLDESTPVRSRPTERQFQHLARRLSRFVGDEASSPLVPDVTGFSIMGSQMTGGSVLSEYTNRVVSDLKTQFDEVQNLRRDLGVMRQLYTEFVKTTKESLGSLRSQTRAVKQVAATKVGGARSYIDTGKKALDTRSQNVLTEVEKLQDIVEGIKEDVLKRQVTPTPKQIKTIQQDVAGVAAELQSLSEHLKTIKPMWKKTWEEELQNIVEEQQFLTHQEEFVNDLVEDQRALVEVFEQVEKVISIRSAARWPRKVGGGFKPPPLDEGHNGLSTVMLEIRGAAVDPEKRLKAIEASQKSRLKELASRSADELHTELKDFVGGKKLKMTGGTEEAERLRQRRNEMTMKAMFGGGGSSGSTSPSPSVVSLVTSPSM